MIEAGSGTHISDKHVNQCVVCKYLRASILICEGRTRIIIHTLDPRRHAQRDRQYTADDCRRKEVAFAEHQVHAPTVKDRLEYFLFRYAFEQGMVRAAPRRKNVILRTDRLEYLDQRFGLRGTVEMDWRVNLFVKECGLDSFGEGD